MSAFNINPVQNILSRLVAVKKNGNGWIARCPNHEDKEQSLSISEGKEGCALIKCFAGCPTTNVLDSMGLRLRDLFSSNGNHKKENGPREEITVATLAADKGFSEEFLQQQGVTPLTDLKDRTVLRITYRLEDNTLAPRHRIRTNLKAKKGSRWTKNYGSIVPYGLWKLGDARKDGMLILVEGESDCWTLWHHGLPALGIPGADMTKTIEAAYVNGISRIYVMHEPDQGGASFIAGVARRLKVIEWPGKAFEFNLGDAKDPNELHKRDPSTFKELFQKALDAALPLPEAKMEEKPETEDPTGGLPTIYANDGSLKRVTAAAWAAIHAANQPEKWFRRGGSPIRLEEDDDNRPIMKELFPDRFRHLLARVAFWWKKNNQGEEVAVPPPMLVVKDMLATPNIQLPILVRIVEAPVFSSDGQIQTQPGYHPSNRTYYAPVNGFTVPEVPEKVSPADLVKARDLLEEIVCDFPFTGPSERAHALAVNILPFARDLIDGATPLHLFEAPSPGTGKTLLLEMLVHSFLGHPAPTISEGRDEDEWRKRITAKLLNGPSLILIDNVRHRLDSAALSAAITSPILEDRILGESRIVSLPVRCAWTATGNNPALSNEMARRTVRIRLDAKVDRPWLRDGFRHSDLIGWVRGHRPELVWATLTLIRAWICEGQPRFQGKILGMFESWSKVMGGILEVAGIKGFLGNLEDFYENSDAEGAAWRSFVNAWWDKFAGDEVGVSDLFEIINTLDDSLDLGKGNEKSQKTKLGHDLVKSRDRQFGDYRITLAGTRQRAKRWKLLMISPSNPGEPVNLSEPFSPQANFQLDKNTVVEPIVGSGGEGSPRFTGSLPHDNAFEGISSTVETHTKDDPVISEEQKRIQNLPKETWDQIDLIKKHFPGSRLVEMNMVPETTPTNNGKEPPKGITPS